MRKITGANHGKSSPFDFFKKSTEYVPVEIQESRYSICTECEHFFAVSKQCLKCGCFMHLKTKLAHAECPIGKWAAETSNS